MAEPGLPLPPRFIVITPVRNEEQYLPRTIASMCLQTLKPSRWVLVDDGSEDKTGELVEAAATQHPWISVVRRQDRGFRQAGGVVAAFHDGYALVANDTWDYVVKLDGDLSFAPDYFQNCLREFDADPKLGIAGGTICKLENGAMTPEFKVEPPFHVRGATKIYRRDCFEAIGGLMPAPGWDTVDQLKANMLGWRTRAFSHIHLVHLRPTGAAYGSWKDAVKNGLANYITGYHPLFMATKCLRRMVRKPCDVEGPGLWFGFIQGYLQRIPQVEDRTMIRYLRQQQWRALTFRSNLWRPVPATIDRADGGAARGGVASKSRERDALL
jgi:glycosyltransferase involved in cell wall biosynthesis